MHFFRQLTRNTFSKAVVLWFVAMTAWWLFLMITNAPEGQRLTFGVIYGTVLTICSTVVGLLASRYWGGTKSVMGKGVMLLALGMLAQFFGQLTFSIYNIVLGIDIPYPSIADIGYFGVIPLYIFGIVYLARASGIAVSLRSMRAKLWGIVVPLVLIIFSYIMFLQEYSFADVDGLTAFLDFGYPIGQGIFVALAILTYTLSRGILGGLMRNRILLIVVAFLLQYIADFNFLYQNIAGTWINGGYGDYLYLIAYVVMALGLAQFYVTGKELKSSQ